MKHIKLFEEYIKEEIYTNINLKEHEDIEFIQIPFKLWDDETCIYCDNIDYNLCFGADFFYDNITDNDISNALAQDLSDININVSWEDDMNTIFAAQNTNIHVLRIAKLVKEIKNNIPLKPISMFFDDRSFQHKIPSYIEDGNHRIRALKYLGYTHFPAFVYGNGAEYLINYLR